MALLWSDNCWCRWCVPAAITFIDILTTSIAGPRPSNLLLILLHPYTLSLLRDVLQRVKEFYTHLTRSNHPARKAIAPMIENSKLEFSALTKIMDEIQEVVTAALKGLSNPVSMLL